MIRLQPPDARAPLPPTCDLPSSDDSQTGNSAVQAREAGASNRPRRGWLAGVALSAAAHFAVLLAFVSASPPLPIYFPTDAPASVAVTLTRPPPPPSVARPTPPPGPAQASPAPAGSASATPVPTPPTPRPPARPRLALTPPPTVDALAVPAAPALVSAPAPAPAGLTHAQIAGAATAGSGPGGGDGAGPSGGGGAGTGSGRCDMIRRVEDALRANPGVVAAAARAQDALPASQRALLVWNGDWVLNPGEEGRGLAGLRQAISVAIAFAPRACRAQSMRGLVLLTLADGGDAPRLALGQGQWRWSEFTGVR